MNGLLILISLALLLAYAYGQMGRLDDFLKSATEEGRAFQRRARFARRGTPHRADRHSRKRKPWHTGHAPYAA